jgi:gluconate kinase
VLDGIFRADLHAGTDDETRSRWLESAIHALGQPRRGGERRFFIKLDSWSTRDMGLVRALYPDVPCVFVYRDPAEIITSHMRVRGAHMIPGLLQSELFGVDDATVVAPDEYCARVVASIFDAAHDQLAPGCRLVNYQELPALVTDEILALFGVRPTADELARVRAVAGLDAKNPVLAFDPSQPGRVWPVTTAIRAATDRWAGAAYARLEAARASALVST